MPSAYASDVLKPFSQVSGFPTSGALAARAREQLHNDHVGSPASSHSVTATGSGSGESALSPVQKRSETVLPMGTREGDGVRTWRRMIVEYS